MRVACGTIIFILFTFLVALVIGNYLKLTKESSMNITCIFFLHMIRERDNDFVIKINNRRVETALSRWISNRLLKFFFFLN